MKTDSRRGKVVRVHKWMTQGTVLSFREQEQKDLEGKYKDRQQEK